MSNYYRRKDKKLSKSAKTVFKNLKKVTIEITEEEFIAVCNQNFDGGKHQYEDYIATMMYLYTEIQEFNSAIGMQRLDYISEDDFGNRIHTLISRLPKQIRQNNVYISGQKVVEIDLVQSQPEVLSKLLYERLGDNLFTSVVESRDVYLYIQKNLGLKTRNKAKKVFYMMMFGKSGSYYEKEFLKLFPDLSDFVYTEKNIIRTDNPSKKMYSNICFLLQRKESEVFKNVWGYINREHISFIPIHDSILVKENKFNKALDIFTKHLSYLLHTNISINISK